MAQNPNKIKIDKLFSNKEVVGDFNKSNFSVMVRA